MAWNKDNLKIEKIYISEIEPNTQLGLLFLSNHK